MVFSAGCSTVELAFFSAIRAGSKKSHLSGCSQKVVGVYLLDKKLEQSREKNVEKNSKLSLSSKDMLISMKIWGDPTTTFMPSMFESIS